MEGSIATAPATSPHGETIRGGVIATLRRLAERIDALVGYAGGQAVIAPAVAESEAPAA